MYACLQLVTNDKSRMAYAYVLIQYSLVSVLMLTILSSSLSKTIGDAKVTITND